MYETSETIVLEFDLPGFRLEDISLTVRGVTLVLDAQRPREKTEDQVRFVCVERSHGCFHHAVHIPVSVDPCTIAAEYRRGVLRVTCRKNGDQQVPIKEILD
jgi:HSP20 family protein